jgi:hypothetical protein
MDSIGNTRRGWRPHMRPRLVNRVHAFGLQPYRVNLVCVNEPKFRIKLAGSLPCYIYGNAF